MSDEKLSGPLGNLRSAALRLGITALALAQLAEMPSSSAARALVEYRSAISEFSMALQNLGMGDPGFPDDDALWPEDAGWAARRWIRLGAVWEFEVTAEEPDDELPGMALDLLDPELIGKTSTALAELGVADIENGRSTITWSEWVEPDRMGQA